MYLMVRGSVSLVFAGAMLISLVVIIASIGWIKDLYKMRKSNKYRAALKAVRSEKK